MWKRTFGQNKMRWHWQRRSISSFFSIVFCLVVTETSESLHVASTTTHSSAPEVETTRTGAAADIWSAHTRAAGDIRCFCNLPVCVATGYMCKSEGGGCFSDLEDYSDIYRAKHGCLEMLDRRQQEHCHEPGSNPIHPAVLWCCHKDMCNHIDSPESFKFNTSEDRLFFNGAPQTPIGYNNNEVWFKAATIAVPICGALILFVLIALAIKILRRDSIEQGFIHGSKHGGGIFPPSASHALVLPSTRKTSQYHLHNLDDMSSKKVPLLLQHRNESSPSPQCIMLMNPNSVPTKTSGVGGQQFEKNEANAKLNLAGKSCLLSEQSALNDYTLLVHPLQQSQDLNPSPINLLQKPNNNTANNNLYRNVNLTLAAAPSHQMPLPAESKLYDKQHLASVVTWGDATGSASHV